MIKLGLEKQGVWAKLREARAEERNEHVRMRLYHACGNDVDGVQRVCELVELGWRGRVNARTSYGWTPLMHASFRGHVGSVKALLATGADVNAAST